MKRFLFVALYLLGQNALLAQVIFEDGYFITESSDSVLCKIKNIDKLDNPKDFKFMTDDSDEIKTRTISNTREFGILGSSKFVRSIVDIDRSSSNVEDLSNSRNPIFKQETVFLKVIIEGAGNLYSYTENNLIRYFYKTQTTPLEQLVYKTFILTDRTVRENNMFRQQLLTTVNCSNLSSASYELISYSKNDLTKYFIKYNDCIGSVYKIYKKPKSQNIHLRLRPGINISSLGLSSELYPALDLSFTSSIGFRIGAEIEVVMPFNKNKWSLILEPNFKHLQLETEKDFGLFGFGQGSFSMKYNTVELPIGLRYYIYLTKESKLFANTVFAIDMPINSQIKYETELGPLELNPKTGLSFAIGAGYDYKNILCLEFRYNFAHEILDRNNDGDWTSEYSNLSIILGYTLF